MRYDRPLFFTAAFHDRPVVFICLRFRGRFRWRSIVDWLYFVVVWHMQTGNRVVNCDGYTYTSLAGKWRIPPESVGYINCRKSNQINK